MANFFDDVLAATPDAPAQAPGNRDPSLADYQKRQADADPSEHVITVTPSGSRPAPAPQPDPTPTGGGNFFSDILAATPPVPVAAPTQSAPVAQPNPAPVAPPAVAAPSAQDNGGMLSNANQLVGAAANGITMGFAPRLGAAVDTASQYGDSLFGLNTNPGSYAQNLAKRQAFMDQAYKEHPIAAPVTSAAASMMLPLGAAGGAMQGVNLGTKIVRGGLAGGAIGGVSAASEVPDFSNPTAQDATNIAKGTAVGTALGGAFPAAAAGVGGAYTAAANQLTGRVAGMVPDAQSMLTRALINDGGSVVANKMQDLGARAMPLDAGTNLNSLALGYAGKPGNHKQALVDALTNRNATTNDVMRATVNRNMGNVVGTPARVDSAIKAARSDVHAALPDIHANAPAVDITPVLAHIGEHMSNARGGEAALLKRARDALMRPKAVDPEDIEELNALKVQRKGADKQDHAALDEQIGALTKKIEERPLVPVTDSQAIHNTKEMIDKTIKYGNTELGIAPGEISRTQGQASTVRKMLRKELGDQVPGYADTMEHSAALARQNEQVIAGRESLGDAKVWADDATARYNALSPSEQRAHQIGMRHRAEDALVGKDNDLQALKGITNGVADDGRGLGKIAGVFGQPAADNIQRDLTAEQLFRDNHGKILAGSMTQPRQAAAEAIKDQIAQQRVLIPGDLKNASAAGMLANTAKGTVNKLYGSLQRPVDNSQRDLQIVNAITRQGGDGQELIRQLLGAANARQTNSAQGDKLARALAAALAAGVGATNDLVVHPRGARN